MDDLKTSIAFIAFVLFFMFTYIYNLNEDIEKSMNKTTNLQKKIEEIRLSVDDIDFYVDSILENY